VRVASVLKQVNRAIWLPFHCELPCATGCRWGGGGGGAPKVRPVISPVPPSGIVPCYELGRAFGSDRTAYAEGSGQPVYASLCGARAKVRMGVRTSSQFALKARCIVAS
jgi:hypothetical protein